MARRDDTGAGVRREETVSILIAPSRSGRTLQWTLSERVAKVLLWLAGGVGMAFLVTLGLSGWLLTKVGRTSDLAAENDSLRVQFSRLQDVEDQVRELSEVNRRMRVLLGADGAGQDTSEAEAIVAQSIPGSGGAIGGSEIAGSLRTGGPWRASRPRIAPIQGLISRGFHGEEGTRTYHPGVDIPGPVGAPIRASGGGVVRLAGVDPVYGNRIVLDHGGGLESLYGHASRLLVQEGDSVRAGQKIAEVGSTGQSSAPHLHFEVTEKGEPVDPGLFVREYADR